MTAEELRVGQLGKEILAFRDREQRPCWYVAGLIHARLAEADQQMRDLRTLKCELTSLQSRMHEAGTEPGPGRFCHFIESALGE